MRKTRFLGIRLLCLALAALCLTGIIHPATAEEVTLTEDQTYTTIVHLKASASSQSIGQLEDGTKVTVLGKSGTFYKIDCYDMVGYVVTSQIVHTADDEYFVNCQPESKETKILTYRAPSEALTLRHSLFALAKKQLGSRYVWGSSRPGAFDCSGLTSYLYRQHDIKLHRTAAQQLQDGIIVPREAMMVGDLVFFREAWDPSEASHVGIYAGNGQFIHAPNSRSTVSYSDLTSGYWANHYYGARRMA